MKKSIFIFLFTILSLGAYTQSPKFTIDISVGLLRYKNEVTEFKKPHLLTYKSDGLTDIFSIGKTKNYEFGLQIEILTSKLNGKDTYLVGKTYYIKKSGQWSELTHINHYPIDIKPIRQREPGEVEIMGGFLDHDQKIEIKLNDDYYINR